MTEQLNPETERLILEGLDREEHDPWVALIRFMAPKLCAENPKLLVEMLHRRAKIVADKLSQDLAERFSILTAECGVRLVLAEAR